SRPAVGAGCHFPDQHPCSMVLLARSFPSGLHATPKKGVSAWSRSRRISTQVPVTGSHSRVALSHPELASRLPSGLHPKPYTVKRWPPNTLSGVLLFTSQMVTTVSEPAPAISVPSGL